MDFAILYDDAFLEHHDVGYHPESPERLEAIRERLTDAGLWDQATILSGREATRGELAANHAAEYVDRALEHMRSAPGRFDADTFFSEGSRQASLLAAGGTVDLVAGVIDRTWDFGFALPRPPGHHATPTRAMGFCIFNNIAVAARAALDSGEVERVLVFDWDVHHGNGTQDAFYEDERVMYVSTHQWPFYPGSGLSEEVGHGAGQGFTMNFPFPPGAGDEEYAFAMREAILPLMREFDPGLVLVSAGFDAHRDDLLGSMRLGEEAYAAMTGLLAGAARETAGGRVAFVLEGGYNVEAQARSIEAVIRTMQGGQWEAIEDPPRAPYREVVDRTRQQLRSRWKSIF
jgi:acetoin utilization deacetylase AcuC-like enzyme